MKNALLIPTDFSENAWVATKYAANLAIKFNWDIHVLHVYQKFDRLLATSEFNEAVAKHNEAASIDEMQKLENRIKAEFPKLELTTACIDGNLTETILKVATENNAPFIIMGTKGASGLKGLVFGSNTFEIIQESPIGVIAVPESYQDFKLEKIGMLTNFQATEFDLIDSFIHRTSPAIDLTLMHVLESNKSNDQNTILYWEEKMLKHTGVNSITFRSKQMINRIDVKQPIPYCIEQMILEEGVDLLLLTYTRKSFFASLFSKSLTKSIANELTVPSFFMREYFLHPLRDQ